MKMTAAEALAVFGLSEGASDRETIKKSYRRLVMRYPPESFPDRFAEIREAYSVLVESDDWWKKFLSSGDVLSPPSTTIKDYQRSAMTIGQLREEMSEKKLYLEICRLACKTLV